MQDTDEPSSVLGSDAYHCKEGAVTPVQAVLVCINAADSIDSVKENYERITQFLQEKGKNTHLS